LAALAKESFNPEKKVNCSGYYQFGRRPFGCWKAGGHGPVNLYQAIEQSCNVYFYKLGLEVGIDEWAKYSELLLFGKQTGIDLPLEKPGNLPDKQYLDNRYGEGKWTNGLMLNLSVGQGDLVVTPLQMLQMTSIIAKKGVAYKPHLRLYHTDPISKKKINYKPESSSIPTIPDTAYQIVRKGMQMVVHGTHGTGKASSVPNIISAGKSGTAQNPHGNSHAWFIGFAPFDVPKVAIVVFIENGGGGGAIAAPKAGKLLRLFFEKQKEEPKASQIVAQTTSNE
jgi:penicillin-binding protein 2